MGSSGKSSGGAVALLQEFVLAVEGQVDIQNIPATSLHLWLVFSMFRGVGANLITDDVDLRFNGDAGANYDYPSMRDQNAVLSGVGGTAQDRLRWCQAVHVAPLSANEVWPAELWIPYYARTDRFKSVVAAAAFRDPSAGTDRVTLNGGQWRSTAAINRITILGDAAQTTLGAGTRVSVYGVT